MLFLVWVASMFSFVDYAEIKETKGLQKKGGSRLKYCFYSQLKDSN